MASNIYSQGIWKTRENGMNGVCFCYFCCLKACKVCNICASQVENHFRKKMVEGTPSSFLVWGIEGLLAFNYPPTPLPCLRGRRKGRAKQSIVLTASSCMLLSIHGIHPIHVSTPHNA